MRNRHQFLIAASGIALAVGAALPATAQDDRDARIEALSQRVAELERRQSSGGGALSFGDSNTTFEIYGYVSADLIYDFDSDLGNTIFGLAAIDGTTPDDPNFQAHAWETRLGIRTTTPTSMGDITTQIETDFYGGDDGGELRLRHANVEWNGFRAGRYWTNFMPLEAYPGTLDFQGPAGIAFKRETQFGYLHEFGNGAALGGYIENPAYDSDIPAFIAVATYEAERYYLHGTVMLGSIDDDTGSDTDVWGYTLSGTADLWSDASMNATFTMGEAIASYMVFSNNGFEFQDVNDAGAAVETTAGTLGLSQSVGDALEFRAAYGYRKDDNPSPDATARLQTLHLTGLYSPVENVTMGVEYITGEREIASGETYDADRLQASVEVSF